MRKPRNLVIKGRIVAVCTHDRRYRKSVRLYDQNEGRGLLMGGPGARRISKWLSRAAEWVGKG